MPNVVVESTVAYDGAIGMRMSILLDCSGGRQIRITVPKTCTLDELAGAARWLAAFAENEKVREAEAADA